MLRDVPLDMFRGPVHKRQGKAYEYDLETKDDSEEMRQNRRAETVLWAFLQDLGKRLCHGANVAKLGLPDCRTGGTT